MRPNALSVGYAGGNDRSTTYCEVLCHDSDVLITSDLSWLRHTSCNGTTEFPVSFNKNKKKNSIIISSSSSSNISSSNNNINNNTLLSHLLPVFRSCGSIHT